MAVYEHGYRPYAGRLTSSRSRLLTIPRYAYQDVFQSKIFVAFFATCFVPLLVEAIIIYLRHNLNALKVMNLSLANIVPIDASFFKIFLNIQDAFAFVLAVIIGPVLISRDLSNNALPLYLSRPFSRVEYVLGKTSVLLILTSAVTWIPSLLIFLLQSGLEGGSWFADHLRIAFAIAASSWIWILVVSLLAIALSAWVKWRLAASAALFGIFMFPSVMGALINQLFRTTWGDLINIGQMMSSVTSWLFTGEPEERLLPFPAHPVWVDWAVLMALCLVCLAILWKKIRAYEVVR
ncbi:MAG TPA: ABC transporter permease subunit [Blastocatellia bacterium]|nr:ABC transporter permease subunit [Blastocatellia bacterium]